MLKKLLKYDLIYKLKTLSIFYLLSLFFAILTRIFFSIDNSFIMYIIAKISSGITIAMIANIIINNVIRLWVRFRDNFYKDESYLTHTLPVEKGDLYLSKILTTIITLLISIIIITLTLFIAYYSKENLKMVKDVILPLSKIYESTVVKIILLLLFIIFLEFLNLIQIGYTGIILGHKKNNKKTVFSFVFGFLAYNVMQIFLLIVIYLFALFNKDIMNLFVSNNITDVSILKEIIYISSGVYIFIFIINYIINIKLFKKGVNVD